MLSTATAGHALVHQNQCMTSRVCPEVMQHEAAMLAQRCNCCVSRLAEHAAAAATARARCQPPTAQQQQVASLNHQVLGAQSPASLVAGRAAVAAPVLLLIVIVAVIVVIVTTPAVVVAAPAVAAPASAPAALGACRRCLSIVVLKAQVEAT
ncbi:hypothetical protein COO60DRAFT_1042088 [Scenedesmus sp. NREL 46B-D3]|nr:hypothetical protein COO60DRAFT_1042088 [Scenedesmus sp. NREL 46B-D3]